MALMFPRLARNFVKNGYFPTDEPTLERALTALAPAEASAGPLCILDPCAGEGVAIAEAAHALGREQVQAFAVEYEAERARHARQLVDRCIHGDLMDTLISRQSFGLLWLNPPYGDLSKDTNGNVGYQGQGRARLEKLFYQKALPLLQYGGVLIYIVPHYVLDAELVGWLTRHFAELRIYRAVDTQFKQVVIFGRKVRQRDQASESVKATRALLLQIGLGDAEAEELPVEWPFLPYTVPATAEPEHFYRVTMEPEQFAEEVRPTARALADARHAPGRRAAVAAVPGARFIALASRLGTRRRCDLRSGEVQDGPRARRQRRHPQGEDLAHGVHRARRRFRGRDAHPDRQVRAGHPCLGHDTRLADLRRGVDHPLIAVP